MKIRIIFLPVILFMLSPACTPGREETLFNGKDLDNWIVKAKPQDLERNFWKVREGYIEANTIGVPDHDYVWLQSVREYRNFEMTFEFQAFHESPGNSGIQVRSRYDEDDFWLDGPQIDIHPAGSWRTGMMWDETRGNQRWIFPDIPLGEWVDEEMALNSPAMYYADDDPAWNAVKVSLKGNLIEAWLNNVKITEFQGDGILDDPLHRQRQVGTTGHIAFQIHTGDELKIRFRNIRIREF